MANKKGDKHVCEDCGLAILAEEPCGCEPFEIVLFGEPMKPEKEQEAKLKVTPKSNPKTK